MRLLILGGTVFLGRHIVHCALERGHDITLFNRGIHNPDLFPDVERLRGDRTITLEPLQGRSWDAVIDPSGQTPPSVRASAQLLARKSERYVFISSLSVLADTSQPGADESAPVEALPAGETEEFSIEKYGALKALCEQATRDAFGERAVIVRPGLIVGPDDPSDRFTYWPHRVAEGGEVLAPGKPENGIQIIDVRDLAYWTLAMAEGGPSGTYHATSPAGMMTMGDVVETSREVAGSDASFTWVPDEFLLEQEVGPWMELPLWIPDAPEMRGFYATSVQRAIDAGLRFRPLRDTIRATLDWDRTRPEDTERKAGLDRDKETRVLDAWHAQGH